MQNIKHALLVLISSALLFSCKKEMSVEQFTGGGSKSTGLIGNWAFINMDAKTKSTVELSDGVDVAKTVSLTDYVTINNAGSLKIDAVNIVSKDLTYTINSVVRATLYENGVLIDTFSIPVFLTVPPSSATTTYTLSGADSIYMPGTLLTIGNGTVQSKPSGAKYTIVGDILTMTLAGKEVITQTLPGGTQTTRNEVNAIITYKRQ